MIRAAQYLRVSTRRQERSLAVQAAANRGYADAEGLEIVRTYTDAGVSGLRLKRRAGLRALLRDVLSGAADYTVVLVHDVSRWGRFQDPDEAGHLEFVCRQAGVSVVYTEGGFRNDGSIGSGVVKQIRRAMAAEFVRELSRKTRSAHRRVGEQGYWTGGSCAYGLRRALAGLGGEPGFVYESGQAKGAVSRRTILVAGPPMEVATVRRIFDLFVDAALPMRRIAEVLNSEDRPAKDGASWTETRVRNVLNDETYTGVRVVGRYTSELGRFRSTPRAAWRRVRVISPVLVTPERFAQARARIADDQRSGSDAALIEELRGVLARHGRLSYGIIERDRLAHSAGVYARRFGSLAAAYAKAGYTPDDAHRRHAARIADLAPHQARDYAKGPDDAALLAPVRALFAAEGRLSSELINHAPGVPRTAALRKRFGSLDRVYALVGYRPTLEQRQRFRRRRRHRAGDDRLPAQPPDADGGATGP